MLIVYSVSVIEQSEVEGVPLRFVRIRDIFLLEIPRLVRRWALGPLCSTSDI